MREKRYREMMEGEKREKEREEEEREQNNPVGIGEGERQRNGGRDMQIEGEEGYRYGG